MPFDSKLTAMKNGSLSFKLLALVIIAGVISAFIDPGAKPATPAAPAKALVAAVLPSTTNHSE
jgi:hypothetical protein